MVFSPTVQLPYLNVKQCRILKLKQIGALQQKKLQKIFVSGTLVYKLVMIDYNSLPMQQ